MYVHGFRFYFTPLAGVLFAFPSRYWFTIGQLGVFSLGGWSPHVQSRFLVSRPTRAHVFRVSDTGLSPTMAVLSRTFSYPVTHFRANPISLAATLGISFDFSSYGYLDVSVPHVRFCTLCIQIQMTLRPGFPIRTSRDHSSFASSPTLFAGYHVLHRLQLPRHPPCTLTRLTI